MSKTTDKLIAQAGRDAGRFTVECGSGRGAMGGRVSFGARDAQAMHSLIDSGRARIVHQDSSNVPTGNGHSCRSTIFVCQLVA